jgi:uncharacterized protein (TIGR00255 family)
MTGFGKSEGTIDKFRVTVEIKSVNNRYLDINFRAPSNILTYEYDLRDLIRQKVNRGKINVTIDIKEDYNNNPAPSVDLKKIENFYKTLLTVKDKLNIPGEVNLAHLMQLPNVFESDLTNIDEDKFLSGLKDIFSNALTEFNRMRNNEGEHLIKDMNERLGHIKNTLEFVRENSKNDVQNEFNTLLKRLDDVLETNNFDRSRLEQEIALISDKVDITEEIIRFESHLNQFEQTLKRESELGKKLTFILQEMHREANTINSKTTNIEVSHKIIQVKEEIEKIREQAQNIE